LTCLDGCYCITAHGLRIPVIHGHLFQQEMINQFGSI
jgi:hypothetical protein